MGSFTCCWKLILNFFGLFGLRSSGVMSAQAFERLPRRHVRPRIGESLVHLPPQPIIEPR
jgi:hypothetical protein